jgi:hypothetical protein
MTRSGNPSEWRSRAALAMLLAAVALPARRASAEGEHGFLETVHHHATLFTTVADNGDLNPYAIAVAPVSAGRIHQGDILVDNFNSVSNIEGTGTTIVLYGLSTRKPVLFAELPADMSECPGGVGLSTAMTMLKSGWVIVGSAPSNRGSTRSKGNGGLIVLDPNGKRVATWSGPTINDPWGNMATIDRGTTASLFVSMAGFGVPGPDVRDPKTGYPVTVSEATVLRIDLSIADGQAPVITRQTVVASGFGQRADRNVFLIGPTGLALDSDGTLYVSDALANRIAAIPDAVNRTSTGGTGRTVAEGGLMRRPLALAVTPQGHLLATNGVNGQVVEIDPRTGKQLYAQWINTDGAQSPPGNGNLFGLVMTPDGHGFYFVNDDVNTLSEATR